MILNKIFRSYSIRKLYIFSLIGLIVIGMMSLSSAATRKKTTRTSAPVSAKISNIKVWSGNDNTQVAFYFQGRAQYNVIALPDKKGFVVKSSNASDSDGDRVIPVNDGVITRIEVENIGSGCYITVRFTDVLDYKVSLENRDRNFPVIEIQRPGVSRSSEFPSKTQIAELKKSNKIVVIDPGHGGWHHGASGNGLVEKHVTMAAALQLKEKLDRIPGIKTFLTRDKNYNGGDYYVSLGRRRNIATELDADLFISIHLNAPGSASMTSVRGTEIYYMKYGAASDAEAQRLANLENAADLDEAVITSASDPLTEVLKDERLVALNNQSSLAAGLILNKLLQTGSLQNRGVKHAQFAVLKCTVPSVLLELVFVTNPSEAQLLKDPVFMDDATNKMASAVKEYFSINKGRPINVKPSTPSLDDILSGSGQ